MVFETCGRRGFPLRPNVVFRFPDPSIWFHVHLAGRTWWPFTTALASLPHRRPWPRDRGVPEETGEAAHRLVPDPTAALIRYSKATCILSLEVVFEDFFERLYIYIFYHIWKTRDEQS